MGYTGKIVFDLAKEKEYLTHNPSRRCPNIEKARGLLDFHPVIEVEEGVARFLEYIKYSH